MKLGVFGGTFDPPHIAHLIIAEEVREKLGLETVLWVPAGRPWLKARKDITPAHHRVEMVRLTIEGNSHFCLSLIEVERPGHTYTLDTIRELRRQGDDLYFIAGLDALADLPRWKEPLELLRLCTVVGIKRPGYGKGVLASLEKALPGASRGIILMDDPVIGISSTEIRERRAQGRSIRYWVAPGVEGYIFKNRLYLKSHQPLL